MFENLLEQLMVKFIVRFIETFGPRVFNFIVKYCNNAILDLKMKPLQKLAIDKMKAMYPECKNYQIKKYGNNYHSIFNDVSTCEFYFNENMIVIDYTIIILYRILRDFIWSLEDDNSDEARALLKKYAILDEKGKIKELNFAPSPDLWNNTKNQHA